MHLLEMEAENFKRIRAVRIQFPKEGGTFEIAGVNGAGKSSTVDVIWAALGGKDASPGEPIRAGTRHAHATLDLGEYKVRREWHVGRPSTLTVTDASGNPLRKPQTILDAIYGKFAIDPMGFMHQTSSLQAATLRKVAGLDFSDLDLKRQKAFDERTEVKRSVKTWEDRVNNLPDVPETQEVSAAELGKELAAANAHNKAVEDARQYAKARADDVKRAKDHIAQLEKQLVHARKQLEIHKENAAEAAYGVGTEIDTNGIIDRMMEAETINQRARDYRERQAALVELRNVRVEAEKLTDRIDDIDAERQAILERAKMPVPGLSLDGDVILYNGVPFAQASTAEQIRVSLAMAAALNPTLRLIVVKDGALLLEPALRTIDAWAEENDYQVLVERAAESTIGCGVVIEDGIVVAETGDDGKPTKPPKSPVIAKQARNLFGDE